MAESEIPLMVARSFLGKPQFSCILVDKGKTFLEILQELPGDTDNNTVTKEVPKVCVSTSENGEKIPFHMRIKLEQALKMLRSDVLWVNFEFPTPEVVPPPETRNAFEVLRLAQKTKASLPLKYSDPANGKFQLFNKLVDLCKETKVFFR